MSLTFSETVSVCREEGESTSRQWRRNVRINAGWQSKQILPSLIDTVPCACGRCGGTVCKAVLLSHGEGNEALLSHCPLCLCSCRVVGSPPRAGQKPQGSVVTCSCPLDPALGTGQGTKRMTCLPLTQKHTF